MKGKEKKKTLISLANLNILFIYLNFFLLIDQNPKSLEKKKKQQIVK